MHQPGYLWMCCPQCNRQSEKGNRWCGKASWEMCLLWWLHHEDGEEERWWQGGEMGYVGRSKTGSRGTEKNGSCSIDSGMKGRWFNLLFRSWDGCAGREEPRPWQSWPTSLHLTETAHVRRKWWVHLVISIPSPLQPGWRHGQLQQYGIIIRPSLPCPH